MNELFEQYKNYSISKLESILKLCEEREELEKKSKSDVFIEQNYNFINKIVKRKEYKEYLKSKEEFPSLQEQRNTERNNRINEINNLLGEYNSYDVMSIRNKISTIENSDSFDNLDINPNTALNELKTNGVEIVAPSFEEAFKTAPIYFGNDIDFMKKAIEESYKNVIYDKTNSDELYGEVIDKMIKDPSNSDYVEKLNNYKMELDNPKVVEDGKYKVPHKYMFEELRKNIVTGNGFYDYLSVDGTFSKEFGQEMENLYEDPDFFVGIHGMNKNDEIEQSIFYQGLKNSMQAADNALNRTVAYGNNLTFNRVLDYKIPYNGIPTEAAIILRIPYSAFDKSNPTPIWGSNERGGSNNYLLPEYVYGAYHDRDNRSVTHNNLEERALYAYLKYDHSSIMQGSVIENNINEKTL